MVVVTEEKAREIFARDTAEHEVRVLRREGVYRHLRCHKPSTYMHGFDIVTWPGHLAYTGDMGTFVFARIDDMFKFFESDIGRINPQYWQEKLQAPAPDAVEVYDPEIFEQWVRAWVAERRDEMEGPDYAEFQHAAEVQILDPGGWRDAEHEAYRLLYEFRWHDIGIYDISELRFKTWDLRYLWCCHALVWAIRTYREKVPV